MDNSRHNNPHLGVNKLGKNIRKSPLHQPSTYHQPAAPPPPPPPQPQVYNISKNDFRSIVQQLTGTPSRDPIPNNNIPPPIPQLGPPRPPPPHPKPSSMRLQKIRPPPLTPIARPPLNPNPNPNPAGFLPRPGWAESPVTAYMRYLETSLLHSDGARHYPPPAASPGLLPPPHFPAFPSPRSNPNPNYSNHQHPGPMPMPSPGSQFVPPSPSSFLNLLSPRSPYPLLSPGFQYPPPFSPNFSFSPMAGQSGLLGPGPGSHPPLSPGLMFPTSPSGFFNLMSPRWRDM